MPGPRFLLCSCSHDRAISNKNKRTDYRLPASSFVPISQVTVSTMPGTGGAACSLGPLEIQPACCQGQPPLAALSFQKVLSMGSSYYYRAKGHHSGARKATARLRGEGERGMTVRGSGEEGVEGKTAPPRQGRGRGLEEKGTQKTQSARRG